MKSFRLLDRRAGYSLASIGLLLGMVVPAVVPAFASAAQLASRSIALSSSAVSATGVTYEVKFTPTQAAGAFVIDFCDDSPIPGQACTAPGGFSTASVASATAGVTAVGELNSHANQLIATKTMTATAQDVVFTGLVNPNYVTDTTAHHGFYARIVTYDTDTNAGGYASTAEGTGAKDDGGIAMAITQSIGITAAVRETMTFCVSGREPSGDCGALGGGSAITPNSPSLTLGEGTPQALDSGHVSTGSDYAQLSTNALGGAVVNLKTSVSCGGLVRSSAPSTCDIAPAPNSGAADFLAGVAQFGVKLGTAASAPSAPSPSGTLNAAANYDHYFMDYNSGSPTTAGVSGTYGSELFNSNSAPVNNKDIQLTFGASASNTTPAGIYGATLSLIATGTF